MCFRPAEMSMNKCPQCGANNKPIATECSQCGAPLKQMKVDFDADQASLDAFSTLPPTKPAPPKAPSLSSAGKKPEAPLPPRV